VFQKHCLSPVAIADYPLIATLKPQSNGQYRQYSNTLISILAVDGWYNEEGTAWGRSLPRPLLAVPNVTAHPSTASVPTSYYSMWHYNCLWSLRVNVTYSVGHVGGKSLVTTYDPSQCATGPVGPDCHKNSSKLCAGSQIKS